jgi:hypothetical protein
MQRQGADSALLYRRVLIIAFVSLVLLLVGSVSVSAQDATTEVTTPQSDTGTAADDQYNGGGGNNDGGDVSNPKDVIPDTTSKKPLPNTGGVPLLGLSVCALALVGVGFSVLRHSIRRDT